MNQIEAENPQFGWAAVIALRLVVVVQCVGVAWWQHATDTSIFSLLWDSPELGGWGWSEAAALRVEQVATWLLVVAAGCTLLRPCWPVLLPVALWQIVHVLAKWTMGGEAWTELGTTGRFALLLAEQAVRIAAPLVLILVDPWPRRPLSGRRLPWAEWGLRIAAAATFAGHGYKALLHQAIFLDYLIAAGDRLLGIGVSEHLAGQMLNWIGIIDIVLAVLILAARWRWVAAYMAAWGAITAFSRIVYGGWPAGYETMLRAANCGVPLVLLLHWHAMRRPHRSAE